GIRVDPDRLGALTTLGTVMARAGDAVRARRAFDEAWELAGELPGEQVLPDLAAALANAGDKRSAQAFTVARKLIDAMDYDDDSLGYQRPHARLALVRALMRAGRFAEAEDVAESMQEDDLFMEEAFRAIAEDLAGSGRFDESKALARRIADHNEGIIAL